MQQTKNLLNPNYIPNNLATYDALRSQQQKLLKIFKAEIYPENIHSKFIDLDDESNNKKAPSNKNIRKKRSRNNQRYMTQPITLLEIRETDEDLNELNTNVDTTTQLQSNDDDMLAKSVYDLYLNKNVDYRRANRKLVGNNIKVDNE